MNADIPTSLWFVSRERVRAGRPLLHITPVGVEAPNGKPLFYRCAKQRLYSVRDCYAQRDQAIRAYRTLGDQEIANDRAKVRRLESRVNAALMGMVP